LGFEIADSEMVTSHSIEITNLEPSLSYYFDVESGDYAGNYARDDNFGNHYKFTTQLGIIDLGEYGYIGYVKESDPTGNYFTESDIIVGSGVQGIYHGAAQFRNLWFPPTATITNATVEFYGRQWIYTGSGGSWNLRMLDSAIDPGWQNHGYTDIHDAVVEDTIYPTQFDGDLRSRTWNGFYYNSGQYPALANHLASSVISFRMDGPITGRYIFNWDTGYGDETFGAEYKPRIIVAYDPVGDTQGPECTNLELSPNPSAGVYQVILTGVLSDGISGGSNVVGAKVYDPVNNIWISMSADDGLFNSPTENIFRAVDISSWPDGEHTIWVRGLDESGNWGNLVSIVLNKKPTYDIPLHYGWNLISLPLNQSTSDTSTIFSSIDGSYDGLSWFDIIDMDDPWKHMSTQKPPSLNDLDDVISDMGFWIHITEPGGVVFECPGTPFIKDVPVSLKPGWNHVSYPSLINKTRTDALNNIAFGPDVDSIWTYDSQIGLWEEIGEFDELEAGRGYWIHSMVDKIWNVYN
jgi:hypothetical protein